MPGMIKAESSSFPVTAASHSALLPTSTETNLAHLSSSSDFSLSVLHRFPQQLKSEERGLWLVYLLLSCANSVAENNIESTNHHLEQLSVLASLTGDPMQRVATYFMEALAARVTKSWPGVYRALQCTQLPSPSELLATHKIFFDAFPILKFAFLTVNQAILDAMNGEKVVHIVALESCEVVQWLALLQAFKIRPEGPPHLRITVVSQKRELLLHMARRLSEEAERLDIPFQFHPVHVSLRHLEVDMLGVKSGEAVAVSSVMKLHSLLAEKDREVADGDDKVPKISVSQTFAGTSFLKNSFVTEELEWLGKQRMSKKTIYRPDSSKAVQRDDIEGTRSPQSHLYTTGSKRNMDTSEDDMKELIRLQARAMAGDSARPSTHQFLAPTSPFDELSVSRQPDSKESDKKESNSRKKIARTLFPWSEGTLQSCPLRLSSSRKKTAIDRVLQILWDLSPKAVVLVEQDSDHNKSGLSERFINALYYYSAMFDSIDSIFSQDSHDRTIIEKHFFGEEIKNIVACEGLERLERHEKLETWKNRMMRAGFSPLFFNASAKFQAEKLLRSFPCDGYCIIDDNSCLTLCWHSTPLISSSVWHV